MGFGYKWKKWMKSFIDDTTYSILVNGSPTAPIAANKGLMQGDPLSPFIFTLVGEGLNRLIDKARDLVKPHRLKPFPLGFWPNVHSGPLHSSISGTSLRMTFSVLGKNALS